MAKELAPKRAARERWTYRGEVPQAIEEDREFYLLFCESKDIEFALKDGTLTTDERARKESRFINLKEAMRRRWIEIMEPKPENPATRLLRLLEKPKAAEENVADGN
jgi:hypothetical protein